MDAEPISPAPPDPTPNATPDPSPNAAPNAAPGAAPDPAPDPERLKQSIIEALKTVYDPEIPVDIYELGLIYGIEVDDGGDVRVEMTLTAPACPAAGALPGEVEMRVSQVPGVRAAKVDVVWEPPWSKDRMSEAAKLTLGLFD